MADYKRIKLSIDNSLKGQASLYKRGHRIVVRLPDTVGLGRNKYWSLGIPATKEGVSRATQILSIINRDIVFEEFDQTLNKYCPKSRQRYREAQKKTVYELWLLFCENKSNSTKERNVDYLKITIGDRIKEADVNNIHNAEKMLARLTEITTPSMTERVMVKLVSLYDWCIIKKLIKEEPNPYKKLLDVIRVDAPAKADPIPRPLSKEEVDLLFKKLSPTFLPIARFCLMVGCRPSEAIGVEWQDLDMDKGYITMGRSFVIKSSKVYKSETSKKGKRRQFPLYPELIEYLNSLTKSCDLINPDPNTGTAYKYDSYSQAWNRVMPKDTTPYGCRDTFISNQIEKGIPPAVVGQWCDNSIATIEKHYLKISNAIKPI